MLIHEVLMLMTMVRHMWKTNRELFANTLFIKDGPLYFRGEQQKIAVRIRKFFAYAIEKKVTIYYVGQEKTGNFVDHLNMLAKVVEKQGKSLDGRYKLPTQEYIQKIILKRPLNQKDKWGKNSHYGGRALIYYNNYQKLVLDIPTGEFVENPTKEALMGFDRIVYTLKRLLSFQYDNALTPLVIANFISSLSNYPSKHILAMFAFGK